MVGLTLCRRLSRSFFTHKPTRRRRRRRRRCRRRRCRRRRCRRAAAGGCTHTPTPRPCLASFPFRHPSLFAHIRVGTCFRQVASLFLLSLSLLSHTCGRARKLWERRKHMWESPQNIWAYPPSTFPPPFPSSPLSISKMWMHAFALSLSCARPNSWSYFWGGVAADACLQQHLLLFSPAWLGFSSYT